MLMFVLAATILLPALTQSAADTPTSTARTDGWSEPARTPHNNRGNVTWRWEADKSAWKLVLHGTPSLSEQHTVLIWVAEQNGFELTVEFDDDLNGPTVIRAVNAADGRHPSLVGQLHGVEATPEALQAQLSAWLPAVVGHLGLDAENRVERALMDAGLNAALEVISALTSSAARLRGYSALARELDELGGKRLSRLLEQAAHDLTADLDMVHFLIRDMDLAFDSQVSTKALLVALSSVENQDVLANVLSQLLVQTDEPAPNAMVMLLEFATLRLTRDNPMATLLDEISWLGLGSAAARAAWQAALASVEADGPHARAVTDMLSTREAPASECVMVVRSAVAHIETESLRAQALGEIHLEQLEDAELADSYLAAMQSFHDHDVLTDLLTSLARRPTGNVATSMLWLQAGRTLPGDGRMLSLLSAIPAAQLANDSIQVEYRALVRTLWSQPAKAEALARLPELAADHQE